MQEHDTDYCEFREIKAVVMTWNAGASTPSNLRHEEKDTNFFREILRVEDLPELLVFGFQELVDLEDKTLTASKRSRTPINYINLTTGREFFQGHQEERFI